MADRCLTWERPYASTGYGQRVRYDRPIRRSETRAAGFPYDPDVKRRPTGFDHRYIAKARMWRRPTPGGFHPEWERSLRQVGSGLITAQAFCPESVATARSCRRAMDRSAVANPPRMRRTHPTGRTLRWYDQIAPTGPWECVEYEDG